MKFQTINSNLTIKFLFLLIFFAFNFGSKCFASNQKDQIENIINEIKNQNHETRSKLTRATFSLFDYNHFFLSSIPHIWKEANQNEKRKITSYYNQYFVNKYFSDILACKNINFNLVDQTSSVICSYTCSNSREKRAQVIRFLKSGSKVSDIQLKGISFLRNEGDSLKNKFNRYNKDEFLENLD
jgi:ABC-type transporter MlaC component